MTADARDAGLVRVVGPIALTAMSVNVLIGAGIFAMPGALSAAAGGRAPLAVLACALAMVGVMTCFAQGGRRLPTSGGAYGYIEAAFGPGAGFIAGTLLWGGNLLACGSVVAALADAIGSLVPTAWIGAVRVAVIIASLAVIGGINLRGVAAGSRFLTAGTVIKLLPLLLFILIGLSRLPQFKQVPSAGTSFDDFGRGVLLALFAFTGIETAVSSSGEVRDPARTIPRALAATLIFVTLIYVLVVWVAQGLLGPELAHSSAPLADAAGRLHPLLRLVMLAGMMVSMFSWLGSDLLCTPRVLFAMARDGTMPRLLGRVNARTHVPQIAILIYAPLAAVLALTGTFAELAVLATLTSAALYIAGCWAVWLLVRAQSGARVPWWLKLAVVEGIGSMCLVIALAARTEILGLVALLAISAGIYGVIRQSRARVQPAA